MKNLLLILKWVFNMPEIQIEEKLGKYESVIFENMKAIDFAHRIHTSGWNELITLISSLIPEIIDADLKKELSIVEEQIIKERISRFKHLQFHHSRKNNGEPQPDDWKFWSNRHINDDLHAHMTSFTIFRVRQIKNIIYVKLQNNGLLLTPKTPNISVGGS